MSSEGTEGQGGRLAVFDLFIPERPRQPFRTTLACPERLYVAWHRHSIGACELLDGDGNGPYGQPQETLWEVREYERAIHVSEARTAYYARVEGRDG